MASRQDYDGLLPHRLHCGERANHERGRRALSSARLRAPAARERARLLAGQQRDARAAPQAQREVPHIVSGIRALESAQALLLPLRGWHAARQHYGEMVSRRGALSRA